MSLYETYNKENNTRSSYTKSESVWSWSILDDHSWVTSLPNEKAYLKEPNYPLEKRMMVENRVKKLSQK